MQLYGEMKAAQLPAEKQSIGTEYVFKMKGKADGSIEKYKERSIKRVQDKVRHRIHRKILSCCKVHDATHAHRLEQVLWLIMDQVDVVTAFLYSVIKEVVYCAIPEEWNLTRVSTAWNWWMLYKDSSKIHVSRMRPLMKSCAPSDFKYPASTRTSTSKLSIKNAEFYRYKWTELIAHAKSQLKKRFELRIVANAHFSWVFYWWKMRAVAWRCARNNMWMTSLAL